MTEEVTKNLVSITFNFSQYLNIDPIFITEEVSNFDTSTSSKFLQYSKRWLISVTAEVSISWNSIFFKLFLSNVSATWNIFAIFVGFKFTNFFIMTSSIPHNWLNIFSQEVITPLNITLISLYPLLRSYSILPPPLLLLFIITSLGIELKFSPKILCLPASMLFKV